MKRFIAVVALALAGVGVASAPAQAKLVNTCAQKNLPAGLHLQVGYCTK
jgi:hypothetical protein